VPKFLKASDTCIHGLNHEHEKMAVYAQLMLTYREKDEAGEPIRRDPAACATMMKLPQARVELMLHRALRAIPLAIDYDPIVASQLSRAPETLIYELNLVVLIVSG